MTTADQRRLTQAANCLLNAAGYGAGRTAGRADQRCWHRGCRLSASLPVTNDFDFRDSIASTRY